MKHIFSTTLLMAALAAPHVQAQDTGTVFEQGSAFGDFELGSASLNASDIMGSRIYATDAEIPETVDFGVPSEWMEIGEISDMALDRDGAVRAVIVGIGGFLGVGERDIAVDFDHIEIVREINGSAGYFFVIHAARNEIESAPPYEGAALDPQ